MAYTHQQTNNNGGNNRGEVLSDAYTDEIADSPEAKYHVAINANHRRNESTTNVGRNNQQQSTSNETSGNAENQSSSTSSSEDKNQDNNDSAPKSPIGNAVKSPKSYKYPLLRRYFEFGPWVGRNRKAQCLGCHLQTSSSQPDRLLKHLNRCNALSEDDKALVADLMNERTANKRKKPMLLRSKKDNGNDSEYFGEDEQHSGLADDLTITSLNASSASISQGGGVKRSRRDHGDRNSQIDEALTRFIMVCRIPLKSIHSREFIEFVRALDPNYRIPSRENITNVLIPGLLNII